MRTDTDKQPTGGIKTLMEMTSCVAQVGIISSEESKIPYDYEDVIQLIVLHGMCLFMLHCTIVFMDAKAVKNCVDKAKGPGPTGKILYLKLPMISAVFKKTSRM